MGVKIETEGLDKIRSWVAKAPAQIGKAADESLGLTVAMGEGLAKSVVPVRTGTLQRSIYSAKQEFLKWVLGTRVYYGLFVEYGTSKMRARPFLRPGMYYALSQFGQIMSRKIEEYLGARGE